MFFRRKQRSHSRRRLQLETLESRQLMAGDVTYSINNGVLTITGDSQGNEIFLGDDGQGNFILRGLAGTTINGSSGPITLQARDIVVRLGEGNDRFLLASAADWDNGAPFMEGWQYGGFKALYDSHGYAFVSGSLTVDLGRGNDTTVVAAAVTEAMLIAGGNGDDGVFLRTHRPTSGIAVPTGRVEVNLGEGNNYAALSLHNVSGEVSVSADHGNDTLLMVFNAFTNLTVDVSGGANSITIQGANHPDPLPLIYADGSVPQPQEPPNETENVISIRSGSGHDKLILRELLAKELMVDTGSGRDAIEVRGVNLRGNVTIRGGNLAGSSIALTDYDKPSMGSLDSMFSLPATSHYRTQIGGNVFITFNNDLIPSQSSANAADVYSVVVGGESATENFRVGGSVTVFGTIYNDKIVVNPMTAGSLLVDGGHGVDEIIVRGITTTGDVTLRLGDGDDRGLVVEDSAGAAVTIGGTLTIDYGRGTQHYFPNSEEDYLPFPGGGSAHFNFRLGALHSGEVNRFEVDRLNVLGQTGMNELLMRAVKAGSIYVALGDASQVAMDVVLVTGNVKMYGGTGSDLWEFKRFGVGGDMTLHTGDGEDGIYAIQDRFFNSSIAGALSIYTGDDSDRVRLGNGENGVRLGADPASPQIHAGFKLYVRRLTIDTGEGTDHAELQGLAELDSLMASLGSGNDEVMLLIHGRVSNVVDGGEGDDLIWGSIRAKTIPFPRQNFERDHLEPEGVMYLF